MRLPLRQDFLLTRGAGQKPVEGETLVRRIPAAIPELVAKPESNISTTYELVRESAKKFGNAKAIGSRQLVRTHQETKKVKKMVDGEEREVDKSYVPPSSTRRWGPQCHERHLLIPQS